MEEDIPSAGLGGNGIPADEFGSTLEQMLQQSPGNLTINVEEFENLDDPLNLGDYGIPEEENLQNLNLEAHQAAEVPALFENLDDPLNLGDYGIPEEENLQNLILEAQQAAEVPAEVQAKKSKCGACEYGRRKCTETCVFKNIVPINKYDEYRHAAKAYSTQNLTKWLNMIPEDKKVEFMENLLEDAVNLKDNPLRGSTQIIKEKVLRIKELEEQNKEKDAMINFLQNGGSNPTAQQPQHQQFPQKQVPYPQNQHHQVPYLYQPQQPHSLSNPTRHQLLHQPQQPQQQQFPQQYVPNVDPQYVNPTHQYSRQVPYPYPHYRYPTHDQFTHQPQQPHLFPQQQPKQNPYTTAPAGAPPHKLPYQPQQPHLFPQQPPQQNPYTTDPAGAPPHQLPCQPQQTHLFPQQPPQQNPYTTAPAGAPPHQFPYQLQQRQQNPYTTAPAGPPPHQFPNQLQQRQQNPDTTAPAGPPPHQFPNQPQQPPQQNPDTNATNGAPPQL